MAPDRAAPRPKPFDICERTFSFSLDVVRAVRDLERQRSRAAWAIASQLIRSGTSIGANVEEAQGGHSRADFVAKYVIARKEARETRYWLRLLAASDLLADAQAAPLIQESEELLRILTAIIKTTRSAESTTETAEER